jgi:putative oxidoreductase
MKQAPTIAASLLGLAFVVFGANHFLHFIPMPADPSPDTAPHKLFMAALAPTGYLGFVKVVEILGGLFLLVPKLRNIGLLFIGPVILNILAFHVFLMKGATLGDPVLILLSVLAAFVLFSERARWSALLK